MMLRQQVPASRVSSWTISSGSKCFSQTFSVTVALSSWLMNPLT